MTVARLYRMEAARGKEEELLASLGDLGTALGSIAGCEGADLLRDLDEPGRFIFIEKWSSADAYEAGKPHVPKQALKQLMALLAGPPASEFCNYLPMGRRAPPA